MKHFALMNIVVGAMLSVLPAIQVGAASHGKDPTKETVLIGVQTVAAGTQNEMAVKLELESAKPMLMPAGTHGNAAMVMEPQPDQKYHFEVKPEDPKSKTRIPYVAVRVSAVNTNSGKTVEVDLHPIWGSSGLHYAANGALPGDGADTATVVVSTPTFARDALKDKDRWTRPSKADFRFRLEKGLIVVD